MASVDDINKLRRMIDDPEEGGDYTDLQLSSLIDSSATLYGAASEVWTEKAAKYATLVDITEGGSQRSNSALFQRAKDLADWYHNKDESAASGGGARLFRLTRGAS
jgi:hypothetical protein